MHYLLFFFKRDPVQIDVLGLGATPFIFIHIPSYDPSNRTCGSSPWFSSFLSWFFWKSEDSKESYEETEAVVESLSESNSAEDESESRYLRFFLAILVFTISADKRGVTPRSMRLTAFDLALVTTTL